MASGRIVSHRFKTAMNRWRTALELAAMHLPSCRTRRAKTKCLSIRSLHKQTLMLSLKWLQQALVSNLVPQHKISTLDRKRAAPLLWQTCKVMKSSREIQYKWRLAQQVLKLPGLDYNKPQRKDSSQCLRHLNLLVVQSLVTISHKLIILLKINTLHWDNHLLSNSCMTRDKDLMRAGVSAADLTNND